MPFEVKDEGGRPRLVLDGRWTVAEAPALEPRLRGAALPNGRDLVLDASGIDALDLTGAWLLRSLERRLAESGTRVAWSPDRPQQLGFIDRTTEGSRRDEPAAEPPLEGVPGALRATSAVPLSLPRKARSTCSASSVR